MVVNTGAFIAAAHRTTEGDAITLGESYVLSLRQIAPFVLTGLLYGVIVVAGLVLFVVPGIVLAIRYFAAPYLVMIEGTSGRAALARSTALAQGRKLRIWWRELGCTILSSLTLYLAGSLVRIALGAALGEPGVGFSEPKPLWSLTVELYANIVSQSLFVILNVLLVKSLRALAASL